MSCVIQGPAGRLWSTDTQSKMASEGQILCPFMELKAVEERVVRWQFDKRIPADESACALEAIRKISAHLRAPQVSPNPGSETSHSSNDGHAIEFDNELDGLKQLILSWGNEPDLRARHDFVSAFRSLQSIGSRHHAKVMGLERTIADEIASRKLKDEASARKDEASARKDEASARRFDELENLVKMLGGTVKILMADREESRGVMVIRALASASC
jgi:hypothetical protein